jgi:hypothetical protein
MDTLTALNTYSDQTISYTDSSANTVTQSRYRINGYLDTNNTVLQNLEELASSATSFVSFDNTSGKWTISINRSGSSVFSFNNDNIIGGIQISETAFDEMYNSVEVQFPHKDLINQRDWVRVDIPTENRFPNEPINSFSISTNTINNPIQAEQIGITELKQSRINKIVEFQTDFSTLGLKAGDLIDITTSIYGWTNKVFRIISISEEDDDDGNIVLSYTCLEYSADIYDYSNLEYFDRSRATGIPPKIINVEIAENEDSALGVDLGRLLGFSALSQLLSILGGIFPTFDDVPGSVEPPPANEDPCGTSPILLGQTTILQKPSQRETIYLDCGGELGEISRKPGSTSPPSSSILAPLFIEI